MKGSIFIILFVLICIGTLVITLYHSFMQSLVSKQFAPYKKDKGTGKGMNRNQKLVFSRSEQVKTKFNASKPQWP